MITPEQLRLLPDHKLLQTLEMFDSMYVLACAHHSIPEEMHKNCGRVMKIIAEFQGLGEPC